AEDGIRDFHVTGVQTCALPIYVCRTAKNTILYEEGIRFSCAEWGAEQGACLHLPQVLFTDAQYGPLMVISWWREPCDQPLYLVKIGRASCRERVRSAVGDGRGQ